MLAYAKAQTCVGKGSLDITVQICSGVNSLEGPVLRVFPNPAAGVFEVKCSEPLLEITLFDLCGKRVWTGEAMHATETVIHAAYLPQGLYTLRWRTEKGLGNRLLRLL